jgi:hypothetical protein
MRHEKIFKRADGSRIKIQVEISLPYISSIFEAQNAWSFHVWLCAKGKRTWESPKCANRWVSGEDARRLLMESYMQHVIYEDVEEVMLELLEKLKPQRQFVLSAILPKEAGAKSG